MVVENATLSYIIRDHNKEKFFQKKFIENAIDFMNKKYPAQPFSLELKINTII